MTTNAVTIDSNSGAQTRAAFRDVQLYTPDRGAVAIDLSDNTNRWGAPPAALRELRASPESALARYPDVYAASLKEALAAYVRADCPTVSPAMIVTDCGSDDVLDSAIRAFAESGDRLAMLQPSFPMVPLFARMNGLSVDPIPLNASYDLDVDRLLAGDPAIVYLCSPNNPTGTIVPRATIEAVIARARGVVIVDEAYVEFSGASVVDLVARSPRLLVVRTLSKAFGLAGLRVGYGIGNATLIAEVEKSRGPYKVSAASERAAVAALTEDLDWVRARVADAVTNRATLVTALRERGLDVLPSASNFLLAPMKDARGIARGMRDRGVAVRAFSDLHCDIPALQFTNGSALRISVGPWPELEAALAAFDEARAACG
ncbi:MAG: hisD [Gemmatimonadetes bacterium]|nr:hisD [Gemmatimonadota bacterium]